MKTISTYFRASGALGLLIAAATMITPASGQVEPVGPLQLVPGQPFSMNYVNFIPPQPRFKEFQFTGFASVPGGALGVLQIDFDYIDSAGNNILVMAPNSPITILGPNPTPIDSGIFFLPFCPSIVSLHLTNVATASAVPIDIVGRFRHQCFPVPEPSSLGLLGSLGLGLLGFVRRNWRS